MGVFKFKQFSVCDDRATMKVGTDAVLLGAWANVSEAKTILDIGSGSGVISLMMAQRSNEDAKIDAVELLCEDSQQASENVANALWQDKISIFNTSIQDFNPGIKYDCIICNPPFFSKSLLPPAESRRTSRHDTTLTHNDLLEVSIRLLAPDGRLSVILPFAEGEAFILKALSRKLFMNRFTRFFTRPGKLQERSLLEFRFTRGELQEDSLVHYQSDNQWTDEYCRLTKGFYLAQ